MIEQSRYKLECIMRNYRSTVVAIEDLPSDTISRMVRLYLANYEGTSEALFRRDLVEKNDVILLYSGTEMVGFTTLLDYPADHSGIPIRVVYSGDTIVERMHWGQQELAFAWIRRTAEIKARAPDTSLYWFLLTKGHRTFRYLSVFGKTTYPHWDTERPDLKRLADQLASARFGRDYNPESGVVEFPTSRGHLAPCIAEPSEEDLAKEATRFFLTKNPGYRQGHELVCLFELESANMRPLAARLFDQTLQSANKA